MPQINEEQRLRIISLRERGETWRNIANQIGCSERGAKYAYSRYRNHRTVQDLPRYGRPRITSRRQDRYLVLEAKRLKLLSLSRLKDRWERIYGARANHTTVWNRLKCHGLRRRRALCKPVLTNRHKLIRRQFCNDLLRWPRNDLRRLILFLDEKTFQSSASSPTVWVTRRKGQRCNPAMMHRTKTSGRFSVNTWCCIGDGQMGMLYEIAGRLDGPKYVTILRDAMIPSAAAIYGIENGGRFTFMHDNCPAHTARVAKNYLQDDGIETLDWPPNSPDLNPIENLWSRMVQLMEKRIPESRDDLANMVKAAFNLIPDNYVRKLTNSFRRRLVMCRRMRGEMIPY